MAHQAVSNVREQLGERGRQGAGGHDELGGELSDGVHKAADGASQLDEGAHSARNGSEKLNEGGTKLNDGIQQLNDKVQQMPDAVNKLYSGVGRLHDGAVQLNDGLGTASSGADQLSNGMVKLQSGTQQLGDGATQIAGGVDKIAGFAGKINELQAALDDINANLDRSPIPGSQQLADQARGVQLQINAGPLQAVTENDLVGQLMQLQAGAHTLATELSDPTAQYRQRRGPGHRGLQDACGRPDQAFGRHRRALHEPFRRRRESPKLAGRPPGQGHRRRRRSTPAPTRCACCSTP